MPGDFDESEPTAAENLQAMRERARRGAIRDLDAAQALLEIAIAKLPTGDERNAVTDINIKLLYRLNIMRSGPRYG